VINIGLLLSLLLLQARAKADGWLEGLHRAFAAGTIAYPVWTATIILVLPWLFGINQGEVESLPETVQDIIYQHPSPILLKCEERDPIYLLDQGEKRWIDTIETFNERGYTWRDVQFVACEELDAIPDGTSIPADAGPPPRP
jgi:hypothetical protein